MAQQSNIQTFIGCDPAFRKNGMAVFIQENNEHYTIIFKNLRHFQKWIDGLEEDKAPEKAIVGVESSNSDLIFENNYQFFLKVCATKDSRGMRNKYAISVGKNMAATQYVIDLFREKYKPRHVIEITPAEKGGKITEKQLKMFYGIEIQNAAQDEIDSAVICVKAVKKFQFQQIVKKSKK